jgi:hypothetical protein
MPVGSATNTYANLESESAAYLLVSLSGSDSLGAITHQVASLVPVKGASHSTLAAITVASSNLRVFVVGSSSKTLREFTSFNNISHEGFVPHWETPASLLLTTQEGDQVSYFLDAVDVLTTMVPAGTAFITMPPNVVSYINSVVVNGNAISFTKGSNTILFNPLPAISVVEVYTTNRLTYAILNGELPPGMGIVPETGELVGTIGNVSPPELTTYEFTVRASNGLRARDRTFSLAATGVDYPTTYESHSLPSLQTLPDTTIQYRRLARLKRGQSFAYTLEVVDPDGDHPTLFVKKVTGLPDIGEYFGGLPLGLHLNGYQIEGVVNPSIPAGQYFFQLKTDDNATVFTFMIEVLSDLVSKLEAVPKINWITETDLGTIYSAEPCFLKIEAKIAGGDDGATVSYFLAPNSRGLPPGLILVPETGEIRGTNGFVTYDSKYSFTIRAESGPTFVDRTFSLILKSRITSRTFYDINLRLMVRERYNFLKNYRDFIKTTMLFRADDANFGLVREPRIYVVRGLNANGVSLETATQGDGSPHILNSDYHGTFDLILGDHKIAVVRDHTGAVAYEVLYRDVYDPNAGSGGFSRTNSAPVEEKVVYPQSKSVKYIYPISLENIRKDLAKDIQFPAVNLLETTTLGPAGPEGLPLWMRAQQVLGQPSSVLGYVPSIVLAHLKPGEGAKLLETLRVNQVELMHDGHVFTFDRYVATVNLIVKQTAFDGTITAFDSIDVTFQTTFDGELLEPHKYL